MIESPTATSTQGSSSNIAIIQLNCLTVHCWPPTQLAQLWHWLNLSNMETLYLFRAYNQLFDWKYKKNFERSCEFKSYKSDICYFYLFRQIFSPWYLLVRQSSNNESQFLFLRICQPGVITGTEAMIPSLVDGWHSLFLF